MSFKRIYYVLLSFFLLTIPFFTFSEENTIIRVGWNSTPGLSNSTDTTFSGYNYDYLQEIATYTGWKYTFVKGDLDQLTTLLKNNEIDIIPSINESNILKQTKTFSLDTVTDFLEFTNIPEGHQYILLVTTETSPLQAYDFDNYNELKIGFLEQENHNLDNLNQLAINTGFSYSPIKYKDYLSLMRALNRNLLDAIVLTGTVLSPGYRILAQFSPTPFYFAMNKKNTSLIYSLNRTMLQIQTKKPELELDLYDKYFNIDSKTPYFSNIDREVINKSHEKPVLIGVLNNNEPVCYWNKKKGYDGIALEILNNAIEKIGLTVKYIPVDINQNLEVLNPVSSSSDIIVLGTTYTPNLPDDRGLFLSNPVYSDSLTVAALRGTDIFSNKANKKIAIIQNFGISLQYAQTIFPDYTIVEYPTLKDCLDSIIQKKTIATINLQSCIYYLIQKPLYSDIEILSTFSEPLNICVSGFTPQSKKIVSVINKGLQQVTQEEYHKIALEHTIKNPYQLTINDTFYKYKAPIFFILLLVVVVILSLITTILIKISSSKKIKKALKTAELASAAKGNFMSRMSHEIRTPLNAVIGYTTIARSELSTINTEEERKQAEMKVLSCLTKSEIASKHLLTIINDVLDMAAIENGKIKVVNERFDFKGLINSLTTVFYSQARLKGVELEVLINSQIDEWITGDQMRINQVLTNLLSNAIKFTPDGGNVTLQINSLEQGNIINLIFNVTDTGIGMTQESLTRLWQPFEQADSSISRRFGGTGLGLSITKNLVELMNGTIDATSVINKGTTFTVKLPLQKAEQPENTGPYDFKNLNVLVVDDDLSTCDYVRLLLSRSGVRSTVVNSGSEAILSVKNAINQNDPFTVCLVDWRMPKMDGIETIKQIRSIAGNKIPIIVITAYDFSEISSKAQELGINMFISKPLFQSSLFNLLVSINKNSSYSIQPKNSSTTRKFKPCRILLAEDNEMNMEIANKILETSGCTVDKAWNGQEALDAYNKMPVGTYKVILMDVQMPIMDGLKATQEIRKLNKEDATTIPIIALTADAFAENIAETKEAGMNDHISKPLDFPAFFQTLSKYLD